MPSGKPGRALRGVTGARLDGILDPSCASIWASRRRSGDHARPSPTPAANCLSIRAWAKRRFPGDGFRSRNPSTTPAANCLTPAGSPKNHLKSCSSRAREEYYNFCFRLRARVRNITTSDSPGPNTSLIALKTDNPGPVLTFLILLFLRAREQESPLSSAFSPAPPLDSQESVFPQPAGRQESQEYSRGTNQDKLVHKDSLCRNCTSERPLYSKGRRQKVTKVTKSGDSRVQERVSRTVFYAAFLTRGLSGIVTFCRN